MSTSSVSNSRPQMTGGEHLRFDAVSFGYPGLRVLTDVSFSVSAGQRVGLIGENGSGKSTLLLLAAGALKPDSGSVTRPDSLGLLHQEFHDAPGTTVDAVLEAAVAPVRRLETLLEELADRITRLPDDDDVARDYDAALQEARNAGLWSLDARIKEVAAGLGIAGLGGHLQVREISGGQRRRLALAALLLGQPAGLLLDEPTNHLDDAAVEFLAAELSARRGPLLMASHDRWFLDAVATELIDLDRSPGYQGYSGESVQGARYTGGYSEYLLQRNHIRLRWKEAWAAQETERGRLQRVADVDGRNVFHTTAPKSEIRGAKKFYSDRAAKTVGGRVAAARRALAELERSEVPPPPAPLTFGGLSGARRGTGDGTARTDAVRGEEILCLSGTGLSGRLEPVSLVLEAGDRLLVEGANGAGKSTLLSLLAGILIPDSGRLDRAPGVSTGLLLQEDRWADPSVTAEAAYRSRLARPDEAPSLGEMGLLGPGEQQRRVGELSPGQRRRIALAVLAAEPPELLLLDEPTNHLALSLSEELERALGDYPGTVVMASHDRWVRRRWEGSRLQL